MPVPLPAALVRHLREGRCMLFAGAGLSAWAGSPNWATLLRALIKALQDEDPDPESNEQLLGLIESRKFLEVADHCKERLGERRYAEFLTEQLRVRGASVPEAHQLVARLPFASVVTTNYDDLLEQGYREIRARWPKAPTHRDTDALGPLLFDGSFFVLKAHGDLNRPDTLVLTTRDYQQMIHGNPAFDALFSAILMTRATLFVGYSLADPDFRLLLDRQLTIFKGNVPERYALMSGVGSVEREVLWRTARIRVLSYPEGKHEEVLVFLRALQEEVTATAQSSMPESRAPERSAVSSSLSMTAPARMSLVEVRVRLRNGAVETRIDRSDSSLPAARADARLYEGPPLDWAALESAVNAAAGTFDPSQEALESAGRLLASYLPVTEIPDDCVVRLHLSPELERLPWELALVGDRQFALRQPIVRATVNVSDASRGYSHVREPARILLIGDPTADMPLRGAREEVEELAAMYGRASGISSTLVVGGDATFQRVAHELLTGDYDVVHFAGHAWFDAQESYLVFERADVVVRESELSAILSRRPPAILVLNSHYTSFVTRGVRASALKTLSSTVPAALATAIPQHGGFTQVAATTGVGAFIGCMGTPEDQAAKRIALKLHEELLAGTAIADALHRARLSVWNPAEKGGSLAATALLYALSGYANCVLRPAP